MKILILSLIGVVFISLCTQPQVDVKFPGTTTQSIIDACIRLCNSYKAYKSLDNGPCLGNPLTEYQDWVCDVAHSPRQASIDDLPENQCSAYREREAMHFVEVDTNCNLIKAV